jgi:DNA repair protein RecO (recombination protein O)
MNNEFSASPGWLIHQYAIRDHLLLVYILTPERLLKGFYRVPKYKHLRVPPQPFLPYHVIWRQKGDNLNIQSLEPIGPAYHLKDLKLWVGMYLNELVFHLLRHEHSEGDLSFFPFYEAILADEEPCPEQRLRQFEHLLLSDCGYGIDFSMTDSGEAIAAAKQYQYTPGVGFQEAACGYQGSDLMKIAAGDFQLLSVLKPIFRQTIDMVLNGTVLNSRELLRQWLKRVNA